jgi:L-alanine-DL-glutamate epimerase-like enolase superfamily enzyme
MKITDIKVTPVNMTLEVPFYWNGGLYSGTSKVIVDVETDVGVVGLGKAPLTDCLHHIQAMTNEPNQSLFRWQYLDVIEGGPFRQTHNVVRVHEGPGLGVILDRKAWQRMNEDFVDNGPMDHFQNPVTPAASNACP